MKTIKVMLAGAALSCLLAACGGGGATSPGDPEVLLQPHPVATDAGPFVPMVVPSPRQAAAARTPDATSFLNWAETAYPNYFPPAHTNKTIDVWTYRYYSKTDIYLGVNTSGDVLGLVGKGGGAYDSYPLGKIADFGCSVYPSDCSDTKYVFGRYEFITNTGSQSVSQFLTEANSQGARGYGQAGERCYDVSCSIRGNLYVKDTSSSATFTYEVVTGTANQSSTAFLAEANSNGARGFGYYGPLCFDNACSTQGNVYVRDTSSSATFAYEVVTGTANQSSTAFFAEANSKGTRGFRYYLPLCFDNSCSTQGNVYVRDTTSNANFIYEVVLGTAKQSSTDFLGEANSKGSRGFQYYLPLCFDNACSTQGNVYVRDTSNSASFIYKFVKRTARQSLTENLEEQNSEWDKGYFLANVICVDTNCSIQDNVYYKEM